MKNHHYPLNASSEEVNIYSFIQSVASNKKYLSKQEIQDAERVLYYRELLRWPSMTAFQHYIKNNMLTNCDITSDDVSRSEQIYGKPLPEIKGKLRRATPKSHSDVTRILLPLPMKGRNLQLYIDIAPP